MSSGEMLRTLRAAGAEIRERFGVERLGLFGSAARGELRDDSDVDVLVAFRGRATLDNYVGLKSHLEALFGRRIDLVTEKGLKPRARAYVERDLVRVL
jgi:predicted nucleotidyltransferase